MSSERLSSEIDPPVAIEGYQVQFFIQPGRGAPHVAMDSPRYWDPPRPMRVIGTRVLRDGVELDPAEHKDLCAEARKRANIPASPGGGSSLRPAFSRQMRLELGSYGHFWLTARLDRPRTSPDRRRILEISKSLG